MAVLALAPWCACLGCTLELSIICTLLPLGEIQGKGLISAYRKTNNLIFIRNMDLPCKIALSSPFICLCKLCVILSEWGCNLRRMFCVGFTVSFHTYVHYGKRVFLASGSKCERGNLNFALGRRQLHEKKAV